MSLHAAAKKGHVSVVKALLTKGASVNSRTKVRKLYFPLVYQNVMHINVQKMKE